MTDRPIRAVTFDLDDTLYPQADHLRGAWAAVAGAAEAAGVPSRDADRLHAALRVIAAEGSDRGRIVDRALAATGLPDELVPTLVAAFRSHVPAGLRLYPGVRAALERLRGRVPIGCLTDGDPPIQRAKLRALGLTGAFDAVVVSDEIGRDYRKPHPLPFRRLLAALGVEPGEAVHVGDRPGKDVAGAVGAGMRAVRVRTGEYARLPDGSAGAQPWFASPDAVAAVERLELEPGLAGRPQLSRVRSSSR